MGTRDSSGPQPTIDAAVAPPGQPRRGASTDGLTPLAASALLPVTMAVMAGSPVAIALAAVSEDAGSRYLTGAIDRVASRLRRSSQPPAPETVQGALVDELRALLDGDQLVARALVPELTEIMRCTGALDTGPAAGPATDAEAAPAAEAGPEAQASPGPGVRPQPEAGAVP